MNTLLDLHKPQNPQFYVVDGRHRLAGGTAAGKIELRCDIVTKNETRRLEIIHVNELLIDPEVQFDFAYQDKRAKWLAANWQDIACEPLTVVPIADQMPAELRYKLKLSMDRDRRQVTSLERFLAEVGMGEPTKVLINALVESHGWKVGRASSVNQIEAVVSLENAFREIGQDGLSCMLALATIWKGDVKANSGAWLDGLRYFVAHGYADRISDRGRLKLQDVVPAVELRKARGEVDAVRKGGHNPESTALAERLRIKAGIRPIKRRQNDRIHDGPGNNDARTVQSSRSRSVGRDAYCACEWRRPRAYTQATQPRQGEENKDRSWRVACVQRPG